MKTTYTNLITACGVTPLSLIHIWYKLKDLFHSPSPDIVYHSMEWARVQWAVKGAWKIISRALYSDLYGRFLSALNLLWLFSISLRNTGDGQLMHIEYFECVTKIHQLTPFRALPSTYSCGIDFHIFYLLLCFGTYYTSSIFSPAPDHFLGRKKNIENEFHDHKQWICDCLEHVFAFTLLPANEIVCKHFWQPVSRAFRFVQ